MNRNSIASINNDSTSINLLKDINIHNRDHDLTFQDEGHKYFVNNVDSKELGYKSVTSFIHEFFAGFNKNFIIKNIQRSKKWTNDKNYKYYLCSKKDILDMWNECTYLGTELHASIECYLQNIPINDDILIRKEFKYFLQFMDDYKNDFTPYRLEMLCYDEDIKITGSVDCLVKYEDGTYGIYDWKRSKNVKNNKKIDGRGKKAKYPLSDLCDCTEVQYFLQLSLYKYILEKKYDFIVRDCFLIICHPLFDNYRKIKVPDMDKYIKKMLDIRKAQIGN
jgi:ATP-dependent exoDNAse (exonuclease V) beta subunit